MDQSTPCVDHGTGGDRRGYGRTRHNGKSVPSHRIAYIKANGLCIADIDGLEVRHLCHNTRCVNPTHLIPGSHAENMQDMVDAGRTKKGADHAVACLTDGQAEAIRNQYEPRSRTTGCRALARKYGVAHATISRVVRGLVY